MHLHWHRRFQVEALKRFWLWWVFRSLTSISVTFLCLHCRMKERNPHFNTLIESISIFAYLFAPFGSSLSFNKMCQSNPLRCHFMSTCTTCHVNRRARVKLLYFCLILLNLFIILKMAKQNYGKVSGTSLNSRSHTHISVSFHFIWMDLHQSDPNYHK